MTRSRILDNPDAFKRRREVAELLEALLAKHRTGTVYVAWDNASTHQHDEVEAVLRGAVGHLVLLYLPTYSPWLNPIEMLYWSDAQGGFTIAKRCASLGGWLGLFACSSLTPPRRG